MKFIALIFCLFFSYFTVANPSQEEVIFYDQNIENLPPVDEMMGVEIIDDPSEQGNSEVKARKKGTEIQLADGGECRRRHGQRNDCGEDHHHHDHDHDRGHSTPPIVVVTPPVVVVPTPVSNICRNGIFYCYTYGMSPVGNACQCYSIYGVFLFNGVKSSY